MSSMYSGRSSISRLIMEPWLSATSMSLKPFLCSSSATVSVIFVAVFLASSNSVPFMCRWLRFTMYGMPSMSTEMKAFM